VIVRQTDENASDIKQLQEDMDALTEEMVALKAEFRRLVEEVRHQRELQAAERRGLILELENALLRAGTNLRLPGGDDT
jgi:hypothetical protein